MKGFRLLSAVTEAVQFQEFSTTDPKIEIFLQIFIRKAMVRFKKNTKEIVVLFMFHVFVAQRCEHQCYCIITDSRIMYFAYLSIFLIFWCFYFESYRHVLINFNTSFFSSFACLTIMTSFTIKKILQTALRHFGDVYWGKKLSWRSLSNITQASEGCPQNVLEEIFQILLVPNIWTKGRNLREIT